jgi:3'(2'), 5'-bisphosphate nucleotidase
MTLDADLLVATRIAGAAAAAILEVRAEARATSTTKADDSPVTAADLAADRAVRAGLGGTGDVVVTEESWGERALPATGRVWIVDPLDGTADFVRGSDDYAVHVALVVDGVPRVGVVHQPASGRVWRGVVDGAASFAETIEADGRVRRLTVATTCGPRPRLAVSVSHPSPVTARILAAIDGVGVPRGSVGLKAALLVQGAVDVYVSNSRRIKVWDSAAPAALVVAAGGVAETSAGQPLRYDGGLAHEEGLALWTPAARATWAARVHEALRSA